MEHGCVAKVGKEKYSRHVCMFYCLLCSLNGLFEGPTAGLGGGAQQAATLILIQSQVAFWEDVLRCLERWVLA